MKGEIALTFIRLCCTHIWMNPYFFFSTLLFADELKTSLMNLVFELIKKTPFNSFTYFPSYAPLMQTYTLLPFFFFETTFTTSIKISKHCSQMDKKKMVLILISLLGCNNILS